MTSAGGVLVSKSVGVGVTSHVPRGLAAGASLAVRPVTPTVNQPVGTQGMLDLSSKTKSHFQSFSIMYLFKLFKYNMPVSKFLERVM